MRNTIRRPARMVPLAFLLAITVGTVLLALPISREGSDVAPVLTALFTAVSATCVTGLVTVDTESYWSGFGEVVITALIQVGGFGIMTMASLLGLVVVGRMRLRGRLITQAETKTIDIGGVKTVVIRIAAITAAVEVVMAAILSARFWLHYDYPLPEALWHGVFHSVSAFNNAGFALYPDSLESFATDPLITVPISLAVIIGGIGFPVLVELVRKVAHPANWSIHTKITLLGTAILLVAGFGSFLALEWDNAATLGPLSLADKIQAAWFSGVMPRTAGFNSMPVGDMNTETWAVTDALMFIGGGSAGTAGGIKVTTFFLLAFVIWAEIRGETQVPFFGRSLSSGVQRQAITVALLGVGLIASATVALLVITDFPSDQVVFEVTSAFATVGLSTGITADLPEAAQLIIIVLMYTGRVGTITVAAALALRTRHRRYRLPEERPIVG